MYAHNTMIYWQRTLSAMHNHIIWHNMVNPDDLCGVFRQFVCPGVHSRLRRHFVPGKHSFLYGSCYFYAIYCYYFFSKFNHVKFCSVVYRLFGVYMRSIWNIKSPKSIKVREISEHHVVHRFIAESWVFMHTIFLPSAASIYVNLLQKI